MKTTIKKYEKLATDHAKTFAKAWDYYAVDTGAYMAGYIEAREAAVSFATNQLGVSHWTEEDTIKGLSELGDNPVEIDLLNGAQQLSVTQFERWRNEITELPFEKALQKMLTNYNFTDIRVYTDANGVISFHGVAKKKEADRSNLTLEMTA